MGIAVERAGQWLQDAMRQRGLSKHHLARELALPIETVDAWLTADHMPRVAWIACLHVCGLPLSWRAWYSKAGDAVFPPLDL
jgi:hypothetical protein